MELIFVRHTAVSPALKGFCYGQSEVALQEPYLPSFEELQHQLPKALPTYSSPAQRCQLLAASLSEAYQTDDRLWEMHFGDWELQPWDQIPQAPLNRWMKAFDTEVVPGGESFAQLAARVAGFCDAFRRKPVPEPRALIITHAGVIRAAMHLLRGVPLKETFSHQVDYGEIVTMQLV